MHTYTFRLLLAMIGLAALIAVLLVTAHALDGDAQGDAAAWVRGGAVAVAVTGLFGLLRELARDAGKRKP